MSNHRQRLAKLERRQRPGDQFRHVHCDGWTIIARAGKAIVALPENGRERHA